MPFLDSTVLLPKKRSDTQSQSAPQGKRRNAKPENQVIPLEIDLEDQANAKRRSAKPDAVELNHQAMQAMQKARCSRARTPSTVQRSAKPDAVELDHQANASNAKARASRARSPSKRSQKKVRCQRDQAKRSAQQQTNGSMANSGSGATIEGTTAVTLATRLPFACLASSYLA